MKRRRCGKRSWIVCKGWEIAPRCFGRHSHWSGMVQILMKDFYTHLARGEDEATSLRQAKLDCLQRLGDRPPVFWAAFTLVGDGSDLNEGLLHAFSTGRR